jgi:hypothetical protein
MAVVGELMVLVGVNNGPLLAGAAARACEALDGRWGLLAQCERPGTALRDGHRACRPARSTADGPVGVDMAPRDELVAAAALKERPRRALADRPLGV